jgi:hypothetical protein
LRKAWPIVAAFCLYGSFALAAEADSSCRTSPNLVGACFAVHGRVFVSNGVRSFHLIDTGSGRVLDVLGREAWASHTDVLPAAVDALLAPSRAKIEIEGEYLVCPFDRTHIARPQAVCIQDASHLIARPR